MIILNLGCGSKTSDQCVNIDWGVYVRIKQNKLLRIVSAPFLSKDRRNRLQKVSDNVVVHDMKKGLPFEDNSVDAVYHSHMLEHIDREYVDGFQEEVLRVLKPGGIQRICVPDLYQNVLNYLNSFKKSENGLQSIAEHDESIFHLLEQSVRREASGTSEQPPLRRFIENKVLGDARKRGETHQWMYDRFNLEYILRKAGFSKVSVLSWNESQIPEWKEIGLEVDDTGEEYKPFSLYIESLK